MKNLFLLLILCFGFKSRAQQTVPDSSFGFRGVVLADSPLMMQSNRIVVQPNGRILLAGSYYYYLLPSFDLVYQLRILRYLPDGRLDSSFNGTGLVEKIIPRSNNISGLDLQPDGKILITCSHGLLERYLPDGSPDYAFNDSARVILDFMGPYDYLGGTALQTDGKIIVTGGINQQYILVYRMMPDGRPDSSFGWNGLLTTGLDSSYYNAGYGVLVQPDGKVLVAGRSVSVGPPYESRFSVVRYLPDGAFDTSFHGVGYSRFSFPGQMHSSAQVIRLLPDGKLLIGGTVYFPEQASSKAYSALLRFTSKGVPDVSFNGSGYLVADSVENTQSIFAGALAVRLQPDGKILMTVHENSIPDNRKLALRRFLPDGAVDPGFNFGGKIVTDISPNQDVAFDIALQADGKILLSGVSNLDDGWPLSNHAIPTIVRYRSAGGLGLEQQNRNLEALRVYPNPASVSFTISYRLLQEEAVTIQLMDMSGRSVQNFPASGVRKKGLQVEPIRLNQPLPPGMYQLRVATHSESVSQPLIIR